MKLLCTHMDCSCSIWHHPALWKWAGLWPQGKAAAKETPKERLKRLMAVQLNKQIAKDTLTATQRKLQEEKDRAARLQIERAALEARRRSALISAPLLILPASYRVLNSKYISKTVQFRRGVTCWRPDRS